MILGKLLIPTSDWDYIGTMTVGYKYTLAEWGEVIQYGWANDIYLSFGSITPSLPIISGFSAYTTRIYWEWYDDYSSPGNLTIRLFVQSVSGGSAKSASAVEIDGVLFTGFNSSGYIDLSSNPFPAEGQPCVIKLK